MTETPNIEPACRAIARALAPEQYRPPRPSQRTTQAARWRVCAPHVFHHVPLLGELPASAIAARVAIAERAELTRALAPDGDRLFIHCRISGAPIGELNRYVVDALSAIADPEIRQRAERDLCSGIHPAMLRSDPESIRVQIREWPIAATVRMAGDLGMIADDCTAARAALNDALHRAPLAEIIVMAEMLRVACGLFGRAIRRGHAYHGGLEKIAITVPPAMNPENLPATLALLRGWIADLLRAIQYARWQHQADRQRQITLADVAAIASECGSPNYRAARTRAKIDDSIELAEISALLGTDGLAQFAIHVQPVGARATSKASRVSAPVAQTAPIATPAVPGKFSIKIKGLA